MTPAAELLTRLLPDAVACVETYRDEDGVALLGGEGNLVGRAVPSRRREFATGRHCARLALARLGVPAAPLLAGSSREPLWPMGIVGSITHCAGYRAAAVARSREVGSLGIDAEPHEALPDGLVDTVAGPEERRRLRCLPHGVHWDRLLFSAKESVYKAWFPRTRIWLGFEDAEIAFDVASATFEAKLAPKGDDVRAARLPLSLRGRYAIARGLVVTAVSWD